MLKRWESPRKEGRNDKGKGGSARRRQLKKQTQMLRNKLKGKGQISDQGGSSPKTLRERPNSDPDISSFNKFKKKESNSALLLFWAA